MCRRLPRSWAVFVLGLSLGASGCRAGPRGVAAGLPARAEAPLRPQIDVAGLGNFGVVDPGLFRSAQPTAEGFREAKRRGVKTVVDLRSTHGDAALLEGLDLAYVRLPMHEWSVGDADVAAFLKIVADPANRPVLVHCASGENRTGALVAAYRVVEQGWSKADAVREMDAFGALPLWVNLRHYVETLDPDRIRALVAAAPPPRIERIP